MDSEHRTIVMVSCLVLVLLFGFIGCTVKYNEGINKLQIACIGSGRAALECKEVTR